MDYSAYLKPCGNVHILSVYVFLLSLKSNARWVATKIMMASHQCTLIFPFIQVCPHHLETLKSQQSSFPLIKTVQTCIQSAPGLCCQFVVRLESDKSFTFVQNLTHLKEDAEDFPFVFGIKISRKALRQCHHRNGEFVSSGDGGPAQGIWLRRRPFFSLGLVGGSCWLHVASLFLTSSDLKTLLYED